MDFDLTQDQKLLADNAASFAKKESPVVRLRKLREHELGWEPSMWKRMGDLGWLALPFPERAGGLDMGWLEVCLVAEQLAATLVPEPIVPSLVAGLGIVRAGDAAQASEHLTPMTEGRTSLALAWAEDDGRYDVASVGTRAEKKGAGWVLRGRKVWALNGHAADALVVSAREGGGPRDRSGVALFVVPRGAKGLTTRTVKTMDGHKAAIVTLDGVEVGAAARLGAADGVAVLSELVDLGAAAACAEGHGIMRAVLWMTVAYLGQREQFGTKIGAFQALQHRAVDMFTETELARSTAILAMIKVGDPDVRERESAVSVAKAQLATSGRHVTQQAIQLHGGIGVTDEHDVGLYFKRMTVLNALWGDEEHHLGRLMSAPEFTARLTDG